MKNNWTKCRAEVNKQR